MTTGRGGSALGCGDALALDFAAATGSAELDAMGALDVESLRSHDALAQRHEATTEVEAISRSALRMMHG
ncbi:MAG TPA: hypothetical protein VGL13_17935 [Polyangiaceae bacterium]